MFTFEGNALLFSTTAAPDYIPATYAQRFQFSAHPRQHLLFCLALFLIIASWVGVEGHLTVVLIWISSMTNEGEHLFLYLWSLGCLLEKNICSGLLPIFESGWYCWVVGVLYVSCIVIPPQTLTCEVCCLTLETILSCVRHKNMPLVAGDRDPVCQCHYPRTKGTNYKCKLISKKAVTKVLPPIYENSEDPTFIRHQMFHEHIKGFSSSLNAICGHLHMTQKSRDDIYWVNTGT